MMTNTPRKRGHAPATRLVQSLVTRGHQALSPACLRVLLLILQRHGDGHPVTHRWLQQQTGTASYAVQRHVLRLREAGLVMWELGRAGTLVPLVRLEVCGG